MSIRLGEKVWSEFHGWVTRFESCDCDECQEKQKGSE